MVKFLRILDSNKEIANKILKATAEVIAPHFSNAVPEIRKSVQELVKDKIASSLEMKSISGGVLQFDIGLTSSQAAETVNIFAEAVANSVDIKYTPIKKSGRKLKGGITILVQPLTYQNIPIIPLEWELNSGDLADVKSLLLELGDTLLVFTYEIQYGASGRSGGARMVKNMAGSWGLGAGISRVPPSFAGTERNNFITRTLENSSFESELSTLLKSALSNK